MSDTPTRGGIGGLRAAPEDEEAAGVDLRADPNEWPPGRELESLLLAHQGIAELRTAYLTLSQQIQEIGQAVAQLQGQAQQLDRDLPQWVNAIRTLDARVIAIGQQVSRNARLACIESAAKARGPGDNTDSVMRLAKAFLEFLEPPQPAPKFVDEGVNGEDLEPGTWRAH